MRYSVYNYGARQYDYYDDGKPSATHATAPPILPMAGLGETPEGAAWRVPAGARKVGAGALPQGRIASMGDLGSDLPKLGIYAGLAFVAYKFFIKKA